MFYTPFNDSIQRQSPYGLLGSSVEYGPVNRRWAVGAHARNLTNTDYITATFGTAPTAFGGRPGPSRQFAIDFTVQRPGRSVGMRLPLHVRTPAKERVKRPPSFRSVRFLVVAHRPMEVGIRSRKVRHEPERIVLHVRVRSEAVPKLTHVRRFECRRV